MADDLAKLHPGTHDVSDQFSSTNIVKALSDYKAIKDGHGDYNFWQKKLRPGWNFAYVIRHGVLAIRKNSRLGACRLQ